MSREFYPPVSAAVATWRQLEHISNNLANVNTSGFKEQRVAFENVMANQGPLGDSFVKPTATQANFESGNVIQDGVDTHMALQGEGFFVVQNGEGEEVLQRSGTFQLDSRGFLVNSMGERVLGESGPIQIQEDQQIQVTLKGQILDQNNQPIAQLLLANGEKLEPLVNTRWQGENIQYLSGNDAPTVVQGSVESSNVNAFRSMMEIVETTRLYETFQKVIQASDEMDSRMNQTTKRSS
jgi:flagellar basal-body rod protein FlgF